MLGFSESSFHFNLMFSWLLNRTYFSLKILFSKIQKLVFVDETSRGQNITLDQTYLFNKSPVHQTYLSNKTLVYQRSIDEIICRRRGIDEMNQNKVLIRAIPKKKKFCVLPCTMHHQT